MTIIAFGKSRLGLGGLDWKWNSSVWMKELSMLSCYMGRVMPQLTRTRRRNELWNLLQKCEKLKSNCGEYISSLKFRRFFVSNWPELWKSPMTSKSINLAKSSVPSRPASQLTNGSKRPTEGEISRPAWEGAGWLLPAVVCRSLQVSFPARPESSALRPSYFCTAAECRIFIGQHSQASGLLLWRR